MSAIKNAVLWIMANTGIDEMLLEAARAFIATSIAVALGLGIPLLDISGNDFRTVVSAGLAACLQVVVRALNPEDASLASARQRLLRLKRRQLPRARLTLPAAQSTPMETELQMSSLAALPTRVMLSSRILRTTATRADRNRLQ